MKLTICYEWKAKVAEVVESADTNLITYKNENGSKGRIIDKTKKYSFKKDDNINIKIEYVEPETCTGIVNDVLDVLEIDGFILKRYEPNQNPFASTFFWDEILVMIDPLNLKEHPFRLGAPLKVEITKCIV